MQYGNPRANEGVRRNKISHDPNNNNWSRSTSNFGHRILAQQGWQPGQYLGAENANHSDHYSAANASHIRVLLREDNLGLGAKVGGNKAETFGLSLFSGVLGRLNGKSDEQVQKQQDALRDAELRQYQVGKYGLMNFVSGGLLVGDRMQKPEEKGAVKQEESNLLEHADNKGEKRKAEDAAGKDSTTDKKRRKVQNSASEDPRQSSSDAKAVSAKKSRRKDKKKQNQHADGEDDEKDASTSSVEEKRSKKRRKKEGRTDDSSSAEVVTDEKARLKAEKRARKEERRKRKEAKRLEKANEESTRSTEAEKEDREAAAPARAVHSGRHAVRHRYIQQKRMAGLDAQAMKEIFMVKAAG